MQKYKLQFGEKWVSLTVPQMAQRLIALETAARELAMKWHQETTNGWRVYWRCSDALAALLKGE